MLRSSLCRVRRYENVPGANNFYHANDKRFQLLREFSPKHIAKRNFMLKKRPERFLLNFLYFAEGYQHKPTVHRTIDISAQLASISETSLL